VTSVVLLDYGSGNLRSRARAQRAGAHVTLTKDYDVALEADGLVVPGVGAFAACMRGLNAVRGGTWCGPAAQAPPVLGICVGMQVPVRDRASSTASDRGPGRAPRAR
jgi:glutamine amidotransferase